MDAPLALSCWHPGGTHDHSAFSGTAADFIAWVWPFHAGMTFTHHLALNVLIEVDGDRAGSECYTLVTLRGRDANGKLNDRMSQNRYIDTFERIDGVWAIRHRQAIDDGWRRSFPVDETDDDFAPSPSRQPDRPIVRSARDRSDYSYTVFRA